MCTHLLSLCQLANTLPFLYFSDGAYKDNCYPDQLLNGYCVSEFGWCGNSAAHCTAKSKWMLQCSPFSVPFHCDSAYVSTCTPTQLNEGYCVSEWGWCGRGKDYCYNSLWSSLCKTPCPAGSSCSAGVGKMCPDGGWNTAGNNRDECSPCPRDSYCANGVITKCPASSANNAVGKSKASDCSTSTTSFSPVQISPLGSSLVVDVTGAMRSEKDNGAKLWLWGGNAQYDGAYWNIISVDTGHYGQKYLLQWSGTNKCLDANWGRERPHMWLVVALSF
jgi:hypothetical protein